MFPNNSDCTKQVSVGKPSVNWIIVSFTGGLTVMIIVVSQIPNTVSQITIHVVSEIPEPKLGLIVTHPFKFVETTPPL